MNQSQSFNPTMLGSATGLTGSKRLYQYFVLATYQKHILEKTLER